MTCPVSSRLVLSHSLDDVMSCHAYPLIVPQKSQRLGPLARDHQRYLSIYLSIYPTTRPRQVNFMLKMNFRTTLTGSKARVYGF